jgi:hypothetical protein
MSINSITKYKQVIFITLTVGRCDNSLGSIPTHVIKKSTGFLENANCIKSAPNNIIYIQEIKSLLLKY